MSINPDGSLEHLMLRIAVGDHAAFRTLYDQQSPQLYGLALRLLRQPEIAADAVHDTFVEIWQRAARFDPERGSVGAWLGTLLRYRAIDIHRRTRREESGYERPEEVDRAPDPLDNLESSEQGRALRLCLDTLEPRYREVVVLAFLDGQSHAELAQTLATPLGTIKSWVRRALGALRSCLGS
ncbi:MULTISPECIES: RNA polymerase sigma factor [Acetobacteraceae]|nr:MULTISPECIES: sigma-70 family RNA polymerase sigma factor [Acetobacteraceae]MCP1239656.1 sigma-70 family RNA polymerase sigma factor [Acetobacter lovaniensis]